jgi:hypothetical protein
MNGDAVAEIICRSIYAAEAATGSGGMGMTTSHLIATALIIFSGST